VRREGEEQVQEGLRYGEMQQAGGGEEEEEEEEEEGGGGQ